MIAGTVLRSCVTRRRHGFAEPAICQMAARPRFRSSVRPRPRTLLRARRTDLPLKLVKLRQNLIMGSLSDVSARLDVRRRFAWVDCRTRGSLFDAFAVRIKALGRLIAVQQRGQPDVVNHVSECIDVGRKLPVRVNSGVEIITHTWSIPSKCCSATNLPAEAAESMQNGSNWPSLSFLIAPFEIVARVQETPMASMLIKGTRFDGFAVSEPVYAEIPVVVAHCSRCKVAGDRAVASCIATDCPSRARRAA